MPAIAKLRRGTAMPGSDVNELVTQFNNAGSYWVCNAAIAINGATYSASAFHVITASGTKAYIAGAPAGFTGITIATGNVCIVAAYITQAGTHAVAAGATAATFGAAYPPTTVPSTAYVYGLILLKASGTSAFTGATTVLDGTNASAVFVNLNGPAGMAISTSPLVLSPG